jgi:predicted nucleic acid-binding protein
MLYIDASALVKRYVEEDGSDAVRDAMDRTRAVSMCRVGFVETARAVGRAGRQADLDRFKGDWRAFDVIEVDEALCEQAAELARSTGLRSLDAMHLAGGPVPAGRGPDGRHLGRPPAPDRPPARPGDPARDPRLKRPPGSR